MARCLVLNWVLLKDGCSLMDVNWAVTMAATMAGEFLLTSLWTNVDAN